MNLSRHILHLRHMQIDAWEGAFDAHFSGNLEAEKEWMEEYDALGRALLVADHYNIESFERRFQEVQ